MPLDKEYVLDDIGNYITFCGKVSKIVKKDDTILGGNITNICCVSAEDQEYETSVLKEIQKDNVAHYKKKVPRRLLLLFFVWRLNPRVHHVDADDLVDQTVFFNVSKFKHAGKDRYVYNADHVRVSVDDMSGSGIEQFSDSSDSYRNKLLGGGAPKNAGATSLAVVNHMGEVISVNDLEPGEPAVMDILKSVFRKSSLDQIQKFQSLIDEWLSFDVERRKKEEYQRECKILEEQKREEVKTATDTLKDLREKMMQNILQ